MTKKFRYSDEFETCIILDLSETYYLKLKDCEKY